MSRMYGWTACRANVSKSARGSIVRCRAKRSDHLCKPGTAEVMGIDAVLHSEISQLSPTPGFPVCAPASRTWSVILDGHWPASGRPTMLDQQPPSHAPSVKRREFLTQRAW
jgi:hypothetical protein